MLRGSSHQNELTKEEVEKLLRHGAYNIFNEEKAGTGEDESKAFLEADIDQIMEQRAKKVVHENTGSQSSAAGGTFSKASFRLSSAKDPFVTTEGTEIDIDDPDFWVKMVGEPRVESFSPVLQKRRRHVLNYQEGGGQDSSESASFDDSDSSSDEDSEAVDENGLPKERRRWGGRRPIDWERKDVEGIVKALQDYGYPDCPNSDSLRKAIRRHGEEEVRGSILRGDIYVISLVSHTQILFS